MRCKPGSWRQGRTAPLLSWSQTTAAGTPPKKAKARVRLAIQSGTKESHSGSPIWSQCSGVTGPATLTLTPPPLGLGGGRSGAAVGGLFLGVFGAEARARHLDEVGPMGEPIKRGGRQQGLAEEIRPLQADQLYATTDPIAECVRKLGGTTLRSIGQIGRLQRVADNDADYVTAADMLAELRDDNQQLVSRLREVHVVCDEHGDVAAASLIEVWIDEAKRRVRFLYEAGRK